MTITLQCRIEKCRFVRTTTMFSARNDILR